MLNRRNFLKSSMTASLAVMATDTIFAQNSNNSIIKPPALQKGDTIGLVTPASPLFEAQRTIIKATEKMHELGYKVKLGKNILKKRGYLAGSIEDRIEDIHSMFLDDTVKAIMTIRGGYGSGQLLPYLDYNLIARQPKIFMGYSDITSLLIGMHQKTGLVTFHGPVAISTFTDYTRTYVHKILQQKSAVGLIEDAPYEDNLQTSNRVWTYRSGTNKGKLMGGNLTLMQMTLGTPFEFDSDNAILFIEEVGEEPYDLDRMLNHLKQAGKFDRCQGVFFDKLDSVEPSSYRPAFNSSLSVEEIIHDIFKDFDFPVCVGLSIGHLKDKPPLPLGIQVRLDATNGQLSFLDSAVA
ncbi:MAG: LD-carboxypeptidase [Caldithrix sp.]|nr:LD-carboxypeptidase [Caldithrix sp.]